MPVVGYRTNRYPGFYVVDSGYDLATRVEDPSQIATMARTQQALGLKSAVLVANPVPADRQLDPTGLDEVLERAWAAADEQGVHGQATTPFLLDFIRVATDGRSLDANTALYFNNIRLAAQIAAELTK